VVFCYIYDKTDPYGDAIMLRKRHCGTALGVPFLCASTITALYVGGRVPQQAPDKPLNRVVFLLRFIGIRTPTTTLLSTLPMTLLFAVDAHRFANTRWLSPQTSIKQMS